MTPVALQARPDLRKIPPMLTARQMVAVLVAVCATAFDATAQETPVRVLRPLLGKVIDDAGNAIAGAILMCHRSSSSSAGKRDPVLNTIASRMNWRWIGTTATDKDGKFACYFIELPGRSYGARFRHTNKQSLDFQVVANDSPMTITIK